jgi:hypothetical protein
MAQLGPDNVKTIIGNWESGTNLEAFNKNLGESMEPEDAARKTFTGAMAGRHGFSEVSIQDVVPAGDGTFSQIIAFFTRDDGARGDLASGPDGGAT